MEATVPTKISDPEKAAILVRAIAFSIILTRILIAHFTFLINFNDAMSHLLIVKRLELYMDLELYKINTLLYIMCVLHNYLRSVNDGDYTPPRFTDSVEPNGDIREGVNHHIWGWTMIKLFFCPIIPILSTNGNVIFVLCWK